ncbi:hypothetical protein Rs2_18947 [Raphanus sativus]|nr:hypothetical protein Rs2_18947 [Raphanus sativus]
MDPTGNSSLSSIRENGKKTVASSANPKPNGKSIDSSAAMEKPKEKTALLSTNSMKPNRCGIREMQEAVIVVLDRSTEFNRSTSTQSKDKRQCTLGHSSLLTSLETKRKKDAKQEAFRKYLEFSRVIDSLTKGSHGTAVESRKKPASHGFGDIVVLGESISVTEAEARAILMAVQSTRFMGYENVIFEKCLT